MKRLPKQRKDRKKNRVDQQATANRLQLNPLILVFQSFHLRNGKQIILIMLLLNFVLVK